MDEFAQTRGVDDLFDDDIVPVTAQAEEIPAEQEIVPDVLPAADFTVPAGGDALSYNDNRNNAVHPDHRKRGSGRGRAHGDRARGRGRGGFGRGGRGAGSATETGQDKGEIPAPEPVPASSSADDRTQQTEEMNEAPANDEEGNQSKDPNKPKVYAVKGDRSGTGGVKKPKLTEDELSERMAAVKIKSAERAAAHARAEADEASFRERERVAQEKQRQERANRRVMIGERERNRQRKLDAQTGREWDAEKKEEMLSAARGSGAGYRRGMHGGVSYDPSSRTAEGQVLENDWEDGSQNGHYRGRTPRGGRGGGRGRGRGQGRRGGGFGRDEKPDVADGAIRPQTSNDPSSPPSFDTKNDFPALPGGIGAATKQESSIPVPNTDPDSTAAPTGTWAEQMESSSQASQSIRDDGKRPGN